MSISSADEASLSQDPSLDQVAPDASVTDASSATGSRPKDPQSERTEHSNYQTGTAPRYNASGTGLTPSKVKPGTSLNAQSNHYGARRQDDNTSRAVWKAMLNRNFAGVQSVDEFLADMGGDPTRRLDNFVQNLKNLNASHPSEFQTQFEKLKAAPNEHTMTEPLLAYLDAVVSFFPEKTRPMFVDTHATSFASMGKEEHYTKPDITATQPGTKQKPYDGWGWQHAGTVIELKYKIDMFKDSELKVTKNATDALIQLAKSARSLLMASGSCHVYVVTVFERCWARILRFDRSSFCATQKFDLTADATFTFLPSFLWRLYNPRNSSTAMYGADDTISIPTTAEKKRMFGAVLKWHSVYKDLENPTEDSLWIRANRFVEQDGERVSEVVNCFTFGGILSISDGLFSRATRVYRVILKEDVGKDNPTIYALKDAWPQVCRRPEVDFYDFLARHLQEELQKPDKQRLRPLFESFAQCHGSIDLSAENNLHLSRPGVLNVPDLNLDTAAQLARRHTRLLLTPVGSPLKKFKSTKSLVEAIFSAMEQHRIAYEAGITHRDVSEGNLLLRELPAAQQEFNGFLLDWDYAEFTEKGAAKFKEWFPECRQSTKAEIDKSLKDMTGTYPFMAIEIVRHLAQQRATVGDISSQENSSNSAEVSVDRHNSLGTSVVRGDAIQKTSFTHGAHHDLESFYWLLVWMVIRYTDLFNDSLACTKLFDHADEGLKLGYLHRRTPFDKNANPPLYGLFEKLRLAVWQQNPGTADDSGSTTVPEAANHSRLISFTPIPAAPSPLPAAPVLLEHVKVMSVILPFLDSSQWPVNDAGRERDLPVVETEEQTQLDREKHDRTQKITTASLGTGPEKRNSASMHYEANEDEPERKKIRSGVTLRDSAVSGSQSKPRPRRGGSASAKRGTGRSRSES